MGVADVQPLQEHAGQLCAQPGQHILYPRAARLPGCYKHLKAFPLVLTLVVGAITYDKRTYDLT